MNANRVELDFGSLDSLFRQSESFSVFCHINADGDAIGALLAFERILNVHYGKSDVKLFSRDGVPEFMKFMNGADRIYDAKTAPAAAGADVALLVDCGTAKRVGGDFSGHLDAAKKIAVVDHHVTDGGYGDLNLTDPGASSTCEVIFRFAKSIGCGIDEDIAAYLYSGIMYDTGRFIHSNTTPEVFQICADLVAAGASPSRIAEEIYNNRALSHLQMLGHTLANMKTAEGGKIAYAVIPRKIYKELGATDEDNEGIVEQLGAFRECEVHTTITETEDGRTRVSMRSAGRVNVGRICKELGGGGHDYAAGIRSEDSLDEVAARVIEKSREALAALDGTD